VGGPVLREVGGPVLRLLRQQKKLAPSAVGALRSPFDITLFLGEQNATAMSAQGTRIACPGGLTIEEGQTDYTIEPGKASKLRSR
jgi:hypothetical protein